MVENGTAAAIHTPRFTLISSPGNAPPLPETHYARAAIVSAISAFWMCSRFSACL